MLREREASRALAQAEQAEARTHALYELTTSRLYLAKAREAASEAHYALALDLAERSTESSQRARTLALARESSLGTRPARPGASSSEGVSAE
jgi:hypothetical protein